MKIQIMHFNGCPHKEYALQALREALAEENIAADVEEIRVETDADARRWSFLGSPTIRVDGLDVEGAGAPNVYPGLRCRIYQSKDGQLY